MPTAMRDVRSRGQSGKHILAVSLSGFDPSVWTGRALQAECEKMEGVGLAHLYPRPLLGSFVLLSIMDIRANEIVD
jgi:hypothetical protein